MNTEPPDDHSEARMPCFDCESGTLIPQYRAMTLDYSKLGKVTVPAVRVLVCDSCGTIEIGDEGDQQIDAWLDTKLNAISPEEVRRFLRKYGLTQREAANITRLGEKNFSRWASGRARPSESVSTYLRLLLEDDGAFEQVKRQHCPVESQFDASSRPLAAPESEEMDILKLVDYGRLTDIGIVTGTRSRPQRRENICRFTNTANLLQFQIQCEAALTRCAAFKDTNQRANRISAGLWVYLGERAGENVATGAYSREALRNAVKRLRNLTILPLMQSARDVQAILADAGVALVFIPTLEESAMRGCTRLLQSDKALIIHALKHRSHSQFWIILFHEIAHLLLHISRVGEAIPDYEQASTDPREIEADQWAFETLAPRVSEIEFLASCPVPSVRDIRRYAKQIGVHTAIGAEILNKRAGRNVINFGYLRKEGEFPALSPDELATLMATSRFDRATPEQVSA